MKRQSNKGACPICGGSGERKSQDKSAPRFKCQDCNGSGEKKIFEMMFWPYSQFPYVLASPGFMEDNGTAYVPSYQGHFRPIRVLPLAEGKKLWAELEALQRERNTALKTLELGFNTRALQTAAFLKNQIRLG